jgi:hypothetical protein
LQLVFRIVGDLFLTKGLKDLQLWRRGTWFGWLFAEPTTILLV